MGEEEEAVFYEPGEIPTGQGMIKDDGGEDDGDSDDHERGVDAEACGVLVVLDGNPNDLLIDFRCSLLANLLSKEVALFFDEVDKAVANPWEVASSISPCRIS